MSRHGWDYVLKKDKDDKKSSSVREQQKGEERLTQCGGKDKINPGVPWAGENHWDFCTTLWSAASLRDAGPYGGRNGPPSACLIRLNPRSVVSMLRASRCSNHLLLQRCGLGGVGAAQRWCPGALSLAGKTSSWLTAWDPRGALQQSQRAQDGSE